MCGIVGIVGNTADRMEPAVIDRMLQTIVHRGPDDAGVHRESMAIIAMRRLSIIDLASGHQPIPNEDRTLWVVCNGEIYNFRELRSELVTAGHHFRTGSDAEVILHAYEQFGERFLDRLDGMFGFALWDSKTRRLVLARDRLGIKPVYYTRHEGNLAFASEIKPLLELPGLHRKVDPAGLRDYVTLGCAVAPRTIFDGISKLGPGECLVFEQGRAQLRTYWKLPDAIDPEPSPEQWAEAVRADLQRAVRTHLVSDVPLGAFLSGGIDSSAIVGLMARELDEPVNTYSIGYAGSAVAEYYNELPFARQVAQRYGTRHREIGVQPDVAQLLPKLIWHLEEPISDTAILTTYLVSELAAESVKVILSGVGGDELFAGYTRYFGDRYAARYKRLPLWMRSRVLEPIARTLPSGRSNRLLDLSRYAKEFVRTGSLEWDARYKSYIALLRPELCASLLEDDCTGPDGFDRIVADTRAGDPLQALFAIDSRVLLPEALLLLSDKMTMATSIECRVPFLDHHLVSTSARIPAGVKLGGGNLKSVLKRALSDVLPTDIIARRKRGFGAPMGAWLQRELLPLRNALLARPAVEARGLFNWPTVHRVCELHDSGREDFTDLLMVMINLELWHRLFIDQQAPGAVAACLREELLAA